MSVNKLTDYIKKKRLAFSIRYGISYLAILVMIITACTPSLYSINILYDPAAITLKPTDKEKKQLITVASFLDARPMAGDLWIGKVVTSRGEQIPVIPQNLKPAQGVAYSIKDYLRKAGYNVAYAMPPWDLKEDSLNGEWGKLVIGGKIDKMEVVCSKTIPVMKYDAEVTFTLYFADVPQKKVLYSVSATGKKSLEHVIFSEGMLETQLNDALQYAIEDVFGSKVVQTKMREALNGTR